MRNLSMMYNQYYCKMLLGGVQATMKLIVTSEASKEHQWWVVQWERVAKEKAHWTINIPNKICNLTVRGLNTHRHRKPEPTS